MYATRTLARLLLWGPPMEFVAKCTIADCQRRLSAGVDPEPATVFGKRWKAGAKRLLGWFDEDRFRLQARIVSLFAYNPYHPIFYGQLIPCQGGTRIAGRFGVLPLARALLIGFYLVCAAVLAGMLFTLTSWGAAYLIFGGALAVLGTIGYALVGFGVAKYVQHLAQAEQREINGYLHTSLGVGLAEASPATE